MNRGWFIILAVMLTTLSILPAAQTQILMTDSPVWGVGFGCIPVGLGWSDFNVDGWTDMVVASGLDTVQIKRLFLNQNGQFASSISWYSNDITPGCHLFIGDLNDDGLDDLVVSSMGITPGFAAVAQVAYNNLGDLLSYSPSWSSQATNSFACTGIDYDRDGDLDLAFAEGCTGNQTCRTSSIFENLGYIVQNIPVWQTDAEYLFTDVAAADVDLDGDLDLVFTGPEAGVVLFANDSGTLETTPSWQSSEIEGGRQLCFGDYDGDGDLDLAVASGSSTTAPDGAYYLFENLAGILDTTPVWSCTDYSEPSCVAWADVDGDGDLDLSGGGFDSPVGVFENENGMLAGQFCWTYDNGGVIQQVAWCDYDNDGLIETSRTFVADGVSQLYCLEQIPVQRLISIRIDGQNLGSDEYCWNPLAGWISLDEIPENGQEIVIDYMYSYDLDLAFTGSGIFLFKNLRDETAVEPHPAIHIVPEQLRLTAYPNPFNPSTDIRFELDMSSTVDLRIYDLAGRQVSRMVEATLQAGQHCYSWSGVEQPSGIYLARLQTEQHSASIKLVLMR